MVFITPCPVFTVGKLHLVAVAVQGPSGTTPLDAPQDEIGLFGLFDARMGKWNIGKGM
jgi:hypothetical protein